MSQAAVCYISWLDSARHEFEALVKEKLGAVAAKAIAWRNPRMVCIAASFSHHDRVAMHRLRERIDLVRYRVFDSGLLSLLLIESAPRSASPAPAQRQRRERQVAAGGGDGKPSVQATLNAAPACLRDLYGELDEALTAWGEVEVAPLLHYIAYQRISRSTPDTVELEEGFSRDMHGIGHLGTGDLEVWITSAADFEKASPLIRRAFEAA
jgi:predicted transport protein